METEKKSGKEKAKELWEKTKTAVGKVSKVVWIILAIVLVAAAAGIIIFLNTRPYSILVTGASASEVTTVTNWLEGRGVRDYRVQGTGTVLVPDRQAAALKAALLTEQYSDGNYDFSGYFDNVSMLSTESERTNAWWIAVMEKMESVVSRMEGVEWADVNITPGEDRGYVLDKNNVVNATASVMVRTRDGRVLDDKVAEAIRGYVSHGVQGLTVESVDLHDTNGNPYYGSESGTEQGGNLDASEWKFRLEQKLQNQIRTEIMNILVPLFGEDNVKAGVSVSLEIDTTDVTEEEHYIPENSVDEEHLGAGQGIIGRRAGSYTYTAPGEAGVGGLVGADPNSDIPTNVEEGITPEDVDNRVSGDWQTDYENSTRTTRRYRDTATVSDVHVALTVNSTTARELNIENLRDTVAKAAGISTVGIEDMTEAEYLASKVSIYAGPYYEPPTIVPDPYAWWPFNDIIPGWIVLAAGAGLLLFLILLIIIIFAARSHKKKKQERLAAAALAAEEEAQQAALEESEQERLEAEAALAEVMGMPQAELVGADVMSLQTEKSMELRQEIRQFVEENPEVAAQLLKSWLRGGDEHG